MKIHLNIGGLIAAGFDATGSYLLTVSHSGRGVFLTTTLERVARDYSVIYPEKGTSIGIGPIEGQVIPVTELNHQTGEILLRSPDGKLALNYEDGCITMETR